MSFSRLVLPAVLCFLVSGCGRRTGEALERLAIPPFENLSGDPAAAWAGYALSEAVAAQVWGSPRLHPLRVTGERDAAAASATTILEGYLVASEGRVTLNAVRRDLKRNRTLARISVEESFPDGLLRLADSVARWVDPQARSFDTSRVDALRALAESREAVDPVPALERSVSLDPDFGGAYVAWARALLLRGDRDGALAVIGKARSRGDRLSEQRRIDLELIEAVLTNNRELRHAALAALSRATPADAEVFRQLAREESAARRFDNAAAYYRRVVSIDPSDQDGWNSLGYMEAGRRDLDAARKALARYRRLARREANPLDSLGDVHFHLGDFQRAEEYYLGAYEMSHAFLGGATLYKAARARLMTGDVAGANEIFGRLAADGPFAACRKAQWLYLTGRKTEAVAGLRQVTAPEVRPLAEAQLAVWDMRAGKREAVPAGTSFARQLSVASLLVDRRFGEAMPVLRELSAAADPLGSDRVDVLLAWALVETGRQAEAAPLLEVYGTPPAGVEDPLACLAFPRVFQLRAAVLEKQGRHAEAAEAMDLYRRLSRP
ncbi:MAG: hypothetical protein IT159_03760 [Bryobacterales bacterium]|nr:hypothetical protein [Bryobacterales bacterium]